MATVKTPGGIRQLRTGGAVLAMAALFLGGAGFLSVEPVQDQTAPAASAPPGSGCVTCHLQTDSPSGHESIAVKVTCVDCHGGTASVFLSVGATPGYVASFPADRSRP